MSANPANTSIFYDRDGFDTQGAKLMGRQAAGEGFLRGWMQHGGVNPISLWTQSQAQGDLGARQLLEMGWLGQTKRCGPDQLEGVLNTGNLFLPGPGLGEAAWLRHWHGDDRWSICGITHTTASHRALDAICGALHAPTQPWDALICTSKAVLSTIEQLFAGEDDWLTHRFGATKRPRPQLPIIPLGVHSEDFKRDDRVRQTWRQSFGLHPDTICVLWMGRLSFHAKAHPRPLYRALQEAAHNSGKKVCLLLAGWFANEAQEHVFLKSAKELAPSIDIKFIDARPLDARRAVWSMGDIFTLPSDNIQETFGLAPVEGMAAGLPVVATDWNGFRDTVTHGEHGFLLPSFQASAGAGGTLAFAHEANLIDYDHYIGATAQHAGFDHGAAVKAFEALFTNPDLGAKMGAAGQKYVRENLDWSHIIARYKELFAHLAGVRLASKTQSVETWRKQRPTRQDPFALFSTYPTHLITADTWIETTGEAAKLDGIYRAIGNVVWAASMLDPSQIGVLYQKIVQSGKVQIKLLLPQTSPDQLGRLINTIAWMGKHGLIALSWDSSK